MGLLPEIERRYAVKEFRADSVSEAILADIIEAGRLAPSAKNRQAWRFVVVTDVVLRNKIAEAAYGHDAVQSAPCVVALCTTNIDYKMPNGQLSYPVDLAVAGAFMMLQAEHCGIGSCPVTTFIEQDVGKIITMPYGMKIVMLIAFGYPADKPGLRSRLALPRIASRNSW
jgi:nitroreductase